MSEPPDHWEWRSYYYAGSQRLGVHVQGGDRIAGGEYFDLLTDHLGSTTLVLDEEGSVVAEELYKPWGETRYIDGNLPTQYRYTGQKQGELGLYDYGARWYDPTLGRFISPDSLVPESVQGVQAWDRYAYANNNPARYNDPTGHCVDGLTTILCAAAAGAIIGGAVNAFIQYKESGSVNMQEVFSAAVAGAVSGAVLVVAAPVTLIGAVVAGGVANVVGSQASAAYDAFVNPSDDGFWQDFAGEGGIYNGSRVEVANLDDAALDFAIGGLTNGLVHGGTSLGNQALSRASKTFSFIDDPLAQPRTVPSMVDYQYDMRAGQVVPKLVPAYQTLAAAGRGGAGGLAAGITKKAKEIGSEYLNQTLRRITKSVLAN